jgi:uncharacterized protein (DUF927 family)
LDGASNFLYWKARVTLLLKENDLWEIYIQEITPPSDPHQLAVHEKEIRDMQVILDEIKDHLILHFSKKQKTREWFNALVSLFQSDNMKKKIILINKFRSVQMSIFDNVTNYLMRIT